MRDIQRPGIDQLYIIYSAISYIWNFYLYLAGRGGWGAAICGRGRQWCAAGMLNPSQPADLSVLKKDENRKAQRLCLISGIECSSNALARATERRANCAPSPCPCPFPHRRNLPRFSVKKLSAPISEAPFL